MRLKLKMSAKCTKIVYFPEEKKDLLLPKKLHSFKFFAGDKIAVNLVEGVHAKFSSGHFKVFHTFEKRFRFWIDSQNLLTMDY